MAENSEALRLSDMIEHPYAACIGKRFNTFRNIKSCGKSTNLSSVTVFIKLIGARESLNAALIDIIAEFFCMLILKDCVNGIFAAEVNDMNIVDVVGCKVGKMNFFTGNDVEFNANIFV